MSDPLIPTEDLEAAYSSMTGSTAAAIRNNVSTVANDNPDQAAEYQHLARFTKQPLPTVQNNPEPIKAQAANLRVDAENIATQSPHTANFLSDKNKAAISHDDIDNLIAAERVAKTLGETKTSAVGRVLGAGWDAAKGTFNTTDNPLGFTPADYEQLGLDKKPEGALDTIKQIPANLLSGGAGIADLATRALSAPFTGAAASIVQTARELGMDDSGANRLDRDIQGLFISEMGRVGSHPPKVVEPEAIAQHRITIRTQKAEEAAALHEQLTQLNDIAAASLVRARDTTTFSEFMKTASQDAPVKDLYVSAENFAQAAGDKLPEVLQALPQVKEQFEAAAKTGGDIRMPVEDFAAHIAGTDMAPGIIPHLKTEPEGFSQVEAESFMQTQGDHLKAEVEKVLSQKTGDDAFKASKQVVEEGIGEQLKSVNRFTPQVNKQYASLVSNFYATQAARLGITPEEFAKQYPLRIAAQDIGEGFNQKGHITVKDNGKDEALFHNDGKYVGALTYNKFKDGVQISQSEIEKEFRGQGIGTEAYQKFIDNQLAQGRKVYSDTQVSEAAQRVYSKLLEQGYNIEKHPNEALFLKGADRRGNLSGEPLFTISGKNEAFKQNNLGAFDPKSLTVGLLNGANLSTFLHESGHFFLHVLTDLAGREGAHPEIQADVALLLKKFGVKDVAEWNAMSLEQQRPFHEQFARSVESYLLDGKAPNLELQPVFQRFRGWLLNVYRSAKDFLDQNPEAGFLDDEVRGVMDRMLATSEDIKTAETARNIAPIFKSAEDAKMTPEEFQTYREQDIRGAQDAITELDTRRLRDMQWLDNAKNDAIKALQREANDKRAEIRDEVTKEVMREPVYAADRWIRRGEGPDGEKALGNTKFNPDALREMGYSDKFIQKMSQGGKYGLTSAKGVHPDALAESLGFSSGHELINALDKAEPMREKIAALTDQRMLEQHGDLTDPRSIARAADKAIYNEARNKIIATELTALNKQLGNKQILTQAAKQFAAEMVNKENASRLNPSLYMSNAARMGRMAEEAFKSGNLQDAALAKRNQLINQYAVKAAFEAQKNMRDVLAVARKLDNVAYREKIPGQYLEQIDALLAKYDLRASPRKHFDQTRSEVNLFNWVKAQRDAGFEPAVADWLTVDPRGIPWKELSVEEVKGLGDAVKSMLHMAREAKSVSLKGERLALDKVVAELNVPLIARGEKFTKEELLNPPQAGVDSFLKVALYKMGSALRLSVADLKPQEFKRNAYDLHELEGPFGKYIFDPMFERNYWKQDRLRENSEFFKAWGAKLGKDWQKSLYNLVTNRTLLDPDLSAPGQPVYLKMTRAKLLAMMSHVGNESNFDKLTRGYGWDGATVMKFIHENATKEDWDAVSAQGKIFEKYWPESEAMSRRLGGVPPTKIELRSVNTKFGVYDGWYAPIDYDPIRSKLSAKYGDVMADANEQIGKQQNYKATTTFNGSMQARQAGYTDRVSLDFHGFESRLKDTVHDLAYREVLIDSRKIVNNKDFRTQFSKTFGREEYHGLVKWLDDITNMNSVDPANKGFEKAMSYSRKGIIMTAIAYRLTTVLKHGSSAAFKSLGYMGDAPGAKYFAARALRMATGNAMKDIADAREKFPEIRSRLMQMDRDYKEGSTSMYKAEDWRAKNDRFGHAMVAWSDALTAVPTAWAAYDRAIHEGIPENQGGTGKPMSEAKAVAYANKVVREAHGTALESSRSNFLQAKGVKGLFGTIYGFMNNTFGQLADIKDKTLADESHFSNNPVVAARLLGALVVPAIMAKWVSGSGKDEPWYEWGALAIAGEVAGTVPFVRDAWGMVEYGKTGVDTVGPLRIVQDVVNTLRDAVKEVQGKNTNMIADLSNAIGELAHIGGAGQAGKSLEYLRDYHEGKQHPKDVIDFIKGVTVGAPPKH